ncbi:MAG TPA: cation:proton antiporter [Bacteroidia bacterium]|jgi:Kef-type K+ transport system membrane component KefB|nr:cation:proton antiporter [Bacteroidia bacterium]
MADSNNILITLSALVILSYLFNIIAKYIKIPSVILLLVTGALLKFLGDKFGITLTGVHFFLNFFGDLGLIMIVLEGSLDLGLSRKKFPLVGKSILSAILILAGTCGLIFFVLHYYVGIPMQNAIIYSLPMAVISSAIAIPSVKELSEHKKEFIVYESTFSDIIGIMVFNFAILDNALSSESFRDFFLNILYILVISFVSSGLLVFMLNSITTHIKSFLIFAILILIYSVGKIFHLPSLLLILVFGIMLNNNKYFFKGRLARILQLEKMSTVTTELKLLTAESAFLIRTFFFILFGYTMNLNSLITPEVVITGSLIIACILFARFIFLLFISRTHVIPELFIAPRGLVTVVLFYSIPAHFISPAFNDGIIYYVIIVSSLIMMLGLMFTKTKFSETERLVVGESGTVEGPLGLS